MSLVDLYNKNVAIAKSYKERLNVNDIVMKGTTIIMIIVVVLFVLMMIFSKAKDYYFINDKPINLGMTTEEVSELWGKPKSILKCEHENSPNEIILSYSTQSYDEVTKIYTSKDCDLHFTKNKLTSVSLYDYKLNKGD